MKSIQTENAPKAVGPYSQAVVSNGFVFCAGQVALNPTSGELIGTAIKEQTEQVIKNIQAVLEASGSSLNKVVQTTCYLTNIADFAAFNEVYGTYFDAAKPARVTVGVAALPKNALVEISAIAELT